MVPCSDLNISFADCACLAGIENALLRERMAGLSEEEIQRAIDDQERREKAKNSNKRDAWME